MFNNPALSAMACMVAFVAPSQTRHSSTPSAAEIAASMGIYKRKKQKQGGSPRPTINYAGKKRVRSLNHASRKARRAR